jgi:TM2 domain-containing membrane protein YozV
VGSVSYTNQQVVFYQQFDSVRRNEIVGVLLALFLGGFGLHHFYLRRTGLGILYLCFFWFPLVWVISFFECFFMPGRVRVFNAIQAAGIAAMLGIMPPLWGIPPINVNVNMPPASTCNSLSACGRCGHANPRGSHFCSSCGAGI